jgi:putative hydrolase of the HAD superfamily
MTPPSTRRPAGMGIEVVLFDLDDTLFAHSEAVAAGITAHSTAVGLRADTALWVALEEEHYHRYLHGEVDFREQRRARARGFVAPVELTDTEAEAWFEAYLLHYRAAWALHDDVLPLLDALPQRVGLITNAELRFQLGKLDALAVTHRFEHVVASGEVGVAKPDARIFLAAAERFGVDVERCAYVGDRLHTDAIGAAAAGMAGIWLDRHRRASADELRAAGNAGVHVIQSLSEVRELLR